MPETAAPDLHEFLTALHRSMGEFYQTGGWTATEYNAALSAWLTRMQMILTTPRDTPEEPRPEMHHHKACPVFGCMYGPETWNDQEWTWQREEPHA